MTPPPPRAGVDQACCSALQFTAGAQIPRLPAARTGASPELAYRRRILSRDRAPGWGQLNTIHQLHMKALDSHTIRMRNLINDPCRDGTLVTDRGSSYPGVHAT